MTKSQDYYVYVLFDEQAIPRYVGKGRDNRWAHHEQSPSKGNRIKTAFIKRTLLALGEVPKVKVRTGLSEDEAFATEIAFISAIGRCDLRTGPLTNMSEGGSGGNFGESIKKAKAAWTPEDRERHRLTYRAVRKKTWDSLTEEQRSAWTRSLVLNSIASRKRRRETDPTYEVNRGKKISAALKSRTPEEKESSRLKRLQSTTHEQRSAAVKKFHDSQTPEERSRRVIGSQTKEQRSERGKRAATARDPIERSNQVRRQQADLTDEQKAARAERAARMGANNIGRLWATNGVLSRRLKKDETLPDGWRYGQRPHKASSRAIHCNSSELSPITISDP